MNKLAAIENDLAQRQGLLETAAANWFNAKREREHDAAVAFLTTEGTVAERQAHATKATAMIGKESEAEYESLKAVVRVLETRATIVQSILRAQREAT